MYCKVHGELSPDKIRSFTSNRRGRSQVVYRCKPCHRKSASTARNKARKDYREGLTSVEPQANIWAKQDRLKKPEIYAASAKRQHERLGIFKSIMEISRVRGITTDQYQSMLKSQDYKCAICHQPETRKSRNGGTAQLCLDHNHTTNINREFLCHNCNVMLGKFHESIEFIQSAINYLTVHGAPCQK